MESFTRKHFVVNQDDHYILELVPPVSSLYGEVLSESQATILPDEQ